MSQPEHEAYTYEAIADRLVAALAGRGARLGGLSDWPCFARLSDQVHADFQVPTTTITPMMRRLLFALGAAAMPRSVVGIGTFVGYALAWLIRSRTDPRGGPFAEQIWAVDVDGRANDIARQNFAHLGHGDRLHVVDADGHAFLADVAAPIDLLYLDIDAPGTGKAAYTTLLRAAAPHLSSGALVLAHDCSVPRFESDFERYHREIEDGTTFDGPWILPVDACGLSVAVAR